MQGSESLLNFLIALRICCEFPKKQKESGSKNCIYKYVTVPLKGAEAEE